MIEGLNSTFRYAIYERNYTLCGRDSSPSKIMRILSSLMSFGFSIWGPTRLRRKRSIIFILSRKYEIRSQTLKDEFVVIISITKYELLV